MSSVLAVSLLGGCRASDKPVTLTVWTYYNGDQLASFERLVEEFNTTIGKKEHITVEASSQGSINDLGKNVLDAAKGRIGALAMPNIFSAYADTAYTLEQMGQVVDLSPYLTEKEKAAYLPNYLEEGDFSDDGSIHIILTTSTKFLRIMEMASIELGGYEMRFDLNTVYVTKNFFSMLNLPSEDVSGLSTRYFQQMLREFDQKLYITFFLSFYILSNVRKALFYRLYGHFYFLFTFAYRGISSYVFPLKRGKFRGKYFYAIRRFISVLALSIEECAYQSIVILILE